MTTNAKLTLGSQLAELQRSGNKEDIIFVVSLITLMVENYSYQFLELLHHQNMRRALHGRNSTEAAEASISLRHTLETHSKQLQSIAKSIEQLKDEFIECNKANTWTHTSPLEKATEEIGELASALQSGPHNSERVLDALLDVAYAGAMPKSHS